MPVDKDKLPAARKVAQKPKPKTLTVNQAQLNRIFARGRAALKKPTEKRSVSDRDAIDRFNQFAPEGSAAKISAAARKSRKSKERKAKILAD